MGVEIIPVGNYRGMTRKQYYHMRRIVRRLEYVHRDEIRAKIGKQIENLFMYGSTKGKGYAKLA